MTKGKLSNNEKYIIKGMLSDKKDVEEIAKALGRASKTVEKYIDVELDSICDTVAKVKMQQVDTQPSKNIEVEDVSPVSNRDIKSVSNRLVSAGLTKLDTERLIAAAITVYKENRMSNIDAERLYTDCIRRMRAGNFMIKKTNSGNEGVAIMTPGASARGDENRKRTATASRYTRGNMYNPKTGEIT